MASSTCENLGGAPGRARGRTQPLEGQVCLEGLRSLEGPRSPEGLQSLEGLRYLEGLQSLEGLRPLEGLAPPGTASGPLLCRAFLQGFDK